MTTGRDKDQDRVSTREVMTGQRAPSEGSRNWLGHDVASGAAKLDEMLLKGATRQQLETARRAVDEHLKHLETEHGLPISHQGGLVAFDRKIADEPKQPVVEVLAQVGDWLQKQYGKQPIPRKKLEEQVALVRGCSKDSVSPSDHCYNRTNDDIPLPPANTPMFIREGKGLYRFVGLSYPYTGPLYHFPRKGKGGPTLIGTWEQGVLTLLSDQQVQVNQQSPAEEAATPVTSITPAVPPQPDPPLVDTHKPPPDLQWLKLVLEIVVLALTVIGSVIALIWRSK